jgi:hypothetical protein
VGIGARTFSCLLGLLLVGCGDSGSDPSGDDQGGLPGIASRGETGADDDGSGDAASGSGGAASADSDGSDGPGADSDSVDDTPKFDVANGEPGVLDCGAESGGNLTFSYIWIANSSQGTVSKIDTVAGVEEGRYRAAAGSDSPSRTSVNQFGDVAVGNRNGAGNITKVAATPEHCVERNGQPGIQTSTGPGDVLGFLEDECVLWTTPLPIVDHGPRAIAWEGGEIDPQTCLNTVPNPRLWVGYGGASQEVYRLDGETGAVLDHISIPSAAGRIYGGAVNAAGDLWMVNRGGNTLIRVDAITLDYEVHPIGATPYGMGVDQNGDPWVVTYAGGAGVDHVYRFDVATATFVDAGGTGGYYRGMNLDREGRNWVAANNPCRLAAFDVQTDALIQDDIVLPGCTTPVGVSIDHGGFVWVVDQNGTAFKVDPDTQAVELTVGGLVGPYTYSDMTGAGLNLVVNPPG